jgi:hypothetical protein
MKQASARLAMKANKNGPLNGKEATLDRIGPYFERPQKLMLEHAVDNKIALMEIFDEIFGHGGYSGVAF